MKVAGEEEIALNGVWLMSSSLPTSNTHKTASNIQQLTAAHISCIRDLRSYFIGLAFSHAQFATICLSFELVSSTLEKKQEPMWA